MGKMRGIRLKLADHDRNLSNLQYQMLRFQATMNKAQARLQYQQFRLETQVEEYYKTKLDDMHANQQRTQPNNSISLGQTNNNITIGQHNNNITIVQTGSLMLMLMLVLMVLEAALAVDGMNQDGCTVTGGIGMNQVAQ